MEGEPKAKSDALYEALFDTSLDGMLLTSPDGTVLRANPAACRMLGYTEPEMRTLGRRGLVDPSDPRLEQALEERARTGDFHGELRFLRKDGSRIPIELTTSVYVAEDGSERTSMVLRDVSERKRAEEEREALTREIGTQKRRLEEAFAQAPSFLAVLRGPEHIFEMANAAYYRLVGHRELIGRPVLEALPEIRDQRYPEILDQVLDTGEPFRADDEPLLIQPGPGEEPQERFVSFVYQPLFDPDGKTSGILTQGVDTTEQVAARRSAEESAANAQRHLARLETILDLLPVAVVITDRSGEITLGNPAWHELWSPEPPPGDVQALKRRRAQWAESGDSVAPEEWPLGRAMRDGQTTLGREMDIFPDQGEPRRILVSAVPISDGEGRVEGAVMVAVDITQQKQLEEQLRQAQKMEAVGRLAGGVAHDFNNLLTAVEGHASILLDDLPADSPFREDVGHILKAGERAADLTRQLLAFSRRQVLEERKVELGDVAVELEKLLRRLIPERIRFQVAASGGSTVVRADPGQLHQVVMNLVVNAVDAIEEDGAITIEVEPVELSESDTREVPWEVEPGPYVQLCVRDTGSGMPAEVREHLFDPFFTTKREGQGTGLGLATVYGIVKQSSGHILVESEPGRGSVFRILLPRVSAEPDPVQRRPPPVSEVGGAVVLLAEDDEAVRTITRRILARSGYKVVEAANGREALALAEDGIDLVISDVVMPDMGGAELQKRLAEQYPDLKVILTSGYSEAEVRGEIRQLGAAFLPKPFTPQALIRCVTGVLHRGTRG